MDEVWLVISGFCFGTALFRWERRDDWRRIVTMLVLSVIFLIGGLT